MRDPLRDEGMGVREDVRDREDMGARDPHYVMRAYTW